MAAAAAAAEPAAGSDLMLLRAAKSIQEKEACCICLAPLGESDTRGRVVVLACHVNHCACLYCISEWLKIANKCPLCNLEVGKDGHVVAGVFQAHATIDLTRDSSDEEGDVDMVAGKVVCINAVTRLDPMEEAALKRRLLKKSAEGRVASAAADRAAAREEQRAWRRTHLADLRSQMTPSTRRRMDAMLDSQHAVDVDEVGVGYRFRHELAHDLLDHQLHQQVADDDE